MGREKRKENGKNEKRSKEKGRRNKREHGRRDEITLALLFTDLGFHWLKMGLVSRSRNLPSETDKGAT